MDFQLRWTYKSHGRSLDFQSAFTNGKEALLIAEDLLKTGRLKEITFVDEMNQSWTLKEMKKLLQEVKEQPHYVKAYFDGGFDLSTKKAGVGAVIYYRQNGKNYRLRSSASFDELESNNEAEYAAFHYVVKQLEELGVHHLPVTFLGDSKVVLKQLAGEWPCYEESFNRWLDRIEEELEGLHIKPTYTHIARKENEEADTLAAQALHGKEISSTYEIE
ncbi:reverse transcriptase-like protein [Priestia endophytica]|jgi:ribonuclease HI|uniref:RNase H type-1 domain-containing protein n=2 Tax=Priestia endophytica TaxID=135735 RepID=A0AAX1Q1R7_9BACI|nr:reverse transcriptase-like protein [Priestia endophytica]KAB2496048.1 reverse transcriptase-like protein [Priestia endophytica]KYG31567.1 hypothetical protein AZF06_07465 [Priestia endophytica]MBG9811568.1 hypothetical protein [Priestia endophytica]MED4073371.1 reverse transcriptase-like protein [Priestia endophytica]RAS71971.1 hypothetical protein A3864_23095 [Priestia endophytica]